MFYTLTPRFSVLAEDGLTQARRWTDALWSDRMESLLHLSETEMTRLFSAAPTFEFLLDPEMSLIDLVKKVRPKFRDSRYSCSPKILFVNNSFFDAD